MKKRRKTIAFIGAVILAITIIIQPITVQANHRWSMAIEISSRRISWGRIGGGTVSGESESTWEKESPSSNTGSDKPIPFTEESTVVKEESVIIQGNTEKQSDDTSGADLNQKAESAKTRDDSPVIINIFFIALSVGTLVFLIRKDYNLL